MRMHKPLFLLMALFVGTAFAADGVVASRTIPSNLSTKTDASDTTVRTTTRGTTSRSVSGAGRDSGAAEKQSRTTVSRSTSNVVTNAASRGTVSRAAGTTKGTTTRSASGDINSNPVVRRAGVVLRPSFADYGGRATIAGTGRQTGSNVSNDIQKVSSRIAKATQATKETLADAREKMELTAELNKSCQDQYNECMDQFCAVVDANQKRCSCSANLSKYSKVEKAVTEANTKLNEVAQAIRYVGLSADEIRAIMTETEAEEALDKTKDTSTTRNMLKQIESMIKDPTTTTTVYDWGDNTFGLDMDLTFSSEPIDIFNLELWTTGTSASSIARMRGTELYNTAKKRCNTILTQCKDAGATQTQITGNYDLAIDKDCIAYENGLQKMNETLLSNVKSANLMLQKARLAVLQNKNQYDALGCVSALETCMKDEMVCGEDYFKCVDPTKAYIDENGEVVLGQDITIIQSFMTDYNNAEIDKTFLADAYGSNTQIGKNSCLGDGKCIVKYLLQKIGTKQKSTDEGLCRPVLDKCQYYTYNASNKKNQYNPYNDIVINYIQRAMVNIKAAQQRVISDYASNCIIDVATCYNQQVSQVTSWASAASAANIYNVMRGACRGVALTCGLAIFAGEPKIDPNTQITVPDSSKPYTVSGCTGTSGKDYGSSGYNDAIINCVSDMFYQSLLCPDNSTYQTGVGSISPNGTSGGWVNTKCTCNTGYDVWAGACLLSCGADQIRNSYGTCVCSDSNKIVRNGVCVESSSGSSSSGDQTLTYTFMYSCGTNASGNLPAGQTLASGTLVTLIDGSVCQSTTGAQFTGWSCNGMSVAAGGQYPIKEATTCTAQWSGAFNITYTCGTAATGTPTTQTQQISGNQVVLNNTTATGCTPNVSGSQFTGWACSDPNGSGMNYGTITAQNNWTVYNVTTNVKCDAQWGNGTHVVTYYCDGGTGAATGTPDPQNQQITGTQGVLNNTTATGCAPSVQGSQFTGWACVDPNGSVNYNIITAQSGWAISNVTTDVKCTAQWGAMVTFVCNPGTGTIAPRAVTNNSVTLPTAQDAQACNNTGKVLDKWNCAGASYDPGSPLPGITASLTCTATWKDAYKVTYNCGDGGTIKSGVSNTATADANGNITIASGDAICTANSGKTFSGWSCGAAGTQIKITANTTCTANWTNNFTVTYNCSDGGTIKSGVTNPVVADANGNITIASGDAICTANSGKTFSSWSCGATGPRTITANTTCTAQWSGGSTTTYTLTYDCNASQGGMGNGSSVSVTNGSATLKSLVGAGCSKPDDKQFTGWKCGDSDTIRSPEYVLPITNNTTCTAQFSDAGSGTTCSESEYTIQYGCASLETGTVLQGQNQCVTGNTTPVSLRQGSICNDYANGRQFQKWICVDASEYIAAAALGDDVPTITVADGKITDRISAKRVVMCVPDWGNSGGGSGGDEPGGGGEQCSDSQYSISYFCEDAFSGKVKGNSCANAGVNGQLLAGSSVCPAPDGQQFSQWVCALNTIDNPLVTVADGKITDNISAGTTIVCKPEWEAQSYTVTIDCNGGTQVGTGVVCSTNNGTCIFGASNTYDNKCTAPSGRNFTGWTCADPTNSTHTYTIDTGGLIRNITSNVVCTANWSGDETYTITYNCNGGSGSVASGSCVEGTTNTTLESSSNCGTKNGVNPVSYWDNGLAQYKGCARDAEFTAQWPEYSITYNLYGGTMASYRQLVYLESTGSGGYINTAKPANSNYTYEIMAAWPSGSSGAFMGAANGNNVIGIKSGGTNKKTWYSNTTGATSSSDQTTADITATTSSSTNKYYIRWKPSLGYITFNGSKYENASGSASQTVNAFTSGNMYLFADGSGSDKDKARIYYYRVYDANGNIVQNLVPAKNGDTYGMYDTVTGTFIAVSGTSFVGGNDVGPLPANYKYGIGTKFISNNNPTRSNSTFAGWSPAISDIGNTTTGAKTYDATWSCNEGYTANSDNTACVKKLTVSYSCQTSASDSSATGTPPANHTTGNDNKPLVSGSQITLRNNTNCAKTGNNFTRWSCGAENTNYTVSGDITCYAVYTAADAWALQYSCQGLVLNGNQYETSTGGSGTAPDPTVVYSNQSASERTVLVLSNTFCSLTQPGKTYRFNGWRCCPADSNPPYSGQDCGGTNYVPVNNQTYTISGNTICRPVWLEDQPSTMKMCYRCHTNNLGNTGDGGTYNPDSCVGFVGEESGFNLYDSFGLANCGAYDSDNPCKDATSGLSSGTKWKFYKVGDGYTGDEFECGSSISSWPYGGEGYLILSN